MNTSRLNEIVQNFSSKKILVIGDIMLDSYIWGNTSRISPEAPVPVIKVDRSEFTLGGAANVALNLKKLSSSPNIVGVVGDDKDGGRLKELLIRMGIESNGIIQDNSRNTTVKTRVIAQNQQVVRVDHEVEDSISDLIQNELMEKLKQYLPESNGVILSDYNKGVFTKEIIENILAEVKKYNLPVYVDSKKDNFTHFQNIRLFKPNLSEFIDGIKLYEDDNFDDHCVQFQNKINAEYLLITMGEMGMSLFSGDLHQIIPTKSMMVHDVSGAGDTVISTFALCDLSDADSLEAATIANYAAGRVCEEVGVVPISKEILLDTIGFQNQDT